MSTSQNIVSGKKTAFDKCLDRADIQSFKEKIWKSPSTHTEFQRLLLRVKMSELLMSNENVLNGLRNFIIWIEKLWPEDPRETTWTNKIAPLREVIVKEESLIIQSAWRQVSAISTRAVSHLPPKTAIRINHASMQVLEKNLPAIITHFTQTREIAFASAVEFLRTLWIKSIVLDDWSIRSLEDKKSSFWIELARMLLDRGYKISFSSSGANISVVPDNTADKKRLWEIVHDLEQKLLLIFKQNPDEKMVLPFWSLFENASQDDKSFVSPQRKEILGLLKSFLNKNWRSAYLGKWIPFTWIFVKHE